MSTSKHIDKICIAAIALTLVVTILFMNGRSLGITVAAEQPAYETRLFDTDRVHTIDIVMDDWDGFIEGCEDEEYVLCSLVIDGEVFKNVAIRAKGNTSLSSVRSMGSQRYSFKIEFDHYDSGKTYYGLDKLCLNNLIQDNTMMKDYLAYTLMEDFGVASPLSSFVYITVNGEDWGLYLAVEAIEESFLDREYGSESGNLYKPDSMSFGGGRGNGRDFSMDDFMESFDSDESNADESGSSFSGSGFSFSIPEGGDFNFSFGGGGGGFNFGGGGGFGMGSDDVKLKYIDDNPDSYSNIFSSAKTDITSADETRLIASLKNLSDYTDLENTLYTDEVLRYFAVHNFLCNGDSYTGSMIHNYYLHEYDGKLSMIPWDYNLAFGTFMGGNASSSVNASIDNPVSSGSVDDRPMVGWIFSDEEYTDAYHELLEEFIERWFEDGELEELIRDTAEMIELYVEKDPTRFCSTEEFENGIEALSEFVSLRGEAVGRQLAGDNTAVDTGNLNLSDMGSMGSTGGFGGGGMGTPPGGFGGGGFSTFGEGDFGGNMQSLPEGFNGDFGGFSGDMSDLPEGFDGDFGSLFGGGSTDGSNDTDKDKSAADSGDEDSDGSSSREKSSGRSGSTGKDSSKSMFGGDMSSRGGSYSGSKTDLTNYVMVGVSVLVLIAGIIIARKKKY